MKDKFLNEMSLCSLDKDIERSHANADDILCRLLRELGYDKLIDLYESIDKLYI